MQKSGLAAISSAILLIQIVKAGWFFSDIRPKDYPLGRQLDVLVGHLHSPISVTKYPFYSLPWCTSTNIYHHYSEDEEIEVKDATDGVNMFDD